MRLFTKTNTHAHDAVHSSLAHNEVQSTNAHHTLQAEQKAIEHKERQEKEREREGERESEIENKEGCIAVSSFPSRRLVVCL